MDEKPKGARPDVKLSAKSKATGGKHHYFASGWRTERGVNLLLDQSAKLFIDGFEVTFGPGGTHYFNMFEGEYKPQGGEQAQSKPAATQAALPAALPVDNYDDSDLPF